MKANCKFCDRPFEKVNERHVFCKRDCGYCYRIGGLPFRDRGWYWSEEENRLVQPDVERERERDKQKAKARPKARQKPKPSVMYGNNQKGEVYLVGSSYGLYKIGISTDARRRHAGLQAQSPVKVTLLHVFKSSKYREAERHLHKKYDHRREHGEWFRLSQSEISEIRSISDYALDERL